MSVDTLRFGRHEGKSLPVVALTDPDWLFWANDEGLLHHVHRAAEVCLKARSIRIPAGAAGARVADYIPDMRGLLSHVEIGYAGGMIRDEDVDVVRLEVIDLSMARVFSAGRKEKTGASAILAALRRHVLAPRGWHRMTTERCAAFFDDDTNFALNLIRPRPP